MTRDCQLLEREVYCPPIDIDPPRNFDLPKDITRCMREQSGERVQDSQVVVIIRERDVERDTGTGEF